MRDAPRYTSLRDYLRVLREQRLLVLLCALAFAGAALIFSSREPEVYESKASMAFREENADSSDIGAPAPAFQTPEQRSSSYAQRLLEPEVAERARERLRTRTSAERLARSVGTQVEARTNFVVITARARQPETARAVADAFALAGRQVFNQEVRDRFQDRADTLARQNRALRRARPTRGSSVDSTILLNTDRINRLESLADFAAPAAVVVRAEADDAPVSPKPVRNTVVGLIFGLTLGFVVAFLRDGLDRRFRRVDEIRSELDLPLLGHVREEILGRSIVGADASRGRLDDQELESFRILRTNLDFLDVDSPVRKVLVTSAVPDEGKSTVSAALAYAYAAAGKRALLVECDLRRPTIAPRLGLERGPGLSDYLAGHAEPKDILQTVAVTPPPINGSGPAEANTVVVITAGTATGQPAELLSSKRFSAFLDEVGAAYDIVVVDSSPLLPVVDTLELVPQVDGVVLCVRASKTTRDQARAARSALGHLPDRPVGVVVTGVRSGDADEYGYYGYAYSAA